MKKTVRETSWRTLMLLTTLFIVFVIFQGTVRTPQLPVAKAQPSFVVHDVPECPNQPQEKPAPSQPQPVVPVVESHLVWFNGKLVDLSKTGWSSGSETYDPEESSPQQSADPNQAAVPVE